MTSEEAIEICRNIMPHRGTPVFEALDLAIKTLEQKPCEDCISRQAVLNTLFYKSDNNCEVVLNKELQDRIKALSPVTPQPKTGRWIYTGDYITDGMLKCSECGYEHDVSERFLYCPNCGARMIESEEAKWIPVEERLPEEHECDDGYMEPSEYVLVQLSNGSMKVSRYWGRVIDEPWMDLAYPTTLSVVAWMPLPGLYMAESEEEE